MPQPAKSPGNLYDATFHADRDARTRATALKVLGHVFSWGEVDSVCDVGCGVGTWLAAARELGARTTRGFEGPWGKSAALVVEPEVVCFQNLEQPVLAERTFDLVLSLEVAEHLGETRAPSFVGDLCALGDLVIFSAAIPLQGGTGHVHERWQSYGAGLFEVHGFAVFDAIRPSIWTDTEIAFWYRQNILAYARRGSAAEAALRARGLREPDYVDLVHPALYEHAERAQPARALRRMARHLLGRA